MEFLIEFEGMPQAILPAAVATFTFTTDISSIYSTCRVVLQECLRSYFNKIRIGQSVTVTFIDDGKRYENYMAVLSYQKIPQAVGLATDQLDVRLISKFYFDQHVPVTACYEANVSSIISSILDRGFPEVKKEIASTADPAALRYQVGKRYQDFITDLLPFATIDGLPVFLFSDHKGTLRLKGIAEAWKSDISNATLLVTGRDTDTDPTSSVNNNIGTRRAYMRSYRVTGDGTNASSTVRSYATTAVFLDPHNTKERTLFNSSETYNPQSLRPTPNSERIFGWEIAPQDAINKATREAFERNMNMFTIDATANTFIGGDLAIMNNVRVIIPYADGVTRADGTPVTLGDGLYIVKGLQYTMEAPRNLKFTRISLLQVSC